MKKIILIILTLLSFNTVNALNDNAENRMLKYAALHQLFDASLSPIGIKEINYMSSVCIYWDFDHFAGYILQEISRFHGVSPDECKMDSVARTLSIPLDGVAGKIKSLPVKELILSFKSDINDLNRKLVVSYEINDTNKSADNLKQQCLDLLEGMSMVDYNGQNAYVGAYDHIYTIEKIHGKNSLLFSCYMPVPAKKWYNVNAGYSPETSYQELPKSAPCNKGKEPFCKFLKDFNNNTKFRVSRRNFSDRANHADYEDGHRLNMQFGFNEFVLEALDESGLLPLRGHYDYKEYQSKLDAETMEYVESCGQWFYPTENSVIYSGWNTSSEFMEEDCSIIILFERCDGEWNTTATWIGGNRLNESVLRIFRGKTVETPTFE